MFGGSRPAPWAAAPPAAVQDATWNLNGTGDFDTGSNWTPNTVPTGTASFGVSNQNSVSFSFATTVGGWTFTSGSSNYIFNDNVMLTFNGAGIVFDAGSGTATILDGNGGTVNFNNTSTAGSADITNSAGGITTFNGSSTAGTATITNQGLINFNDSSSAGSSNINSGLGGFGTINFNATSSAGSAFIGNIGAITFINSSTAGSANLTNNVGDTIQFFGSSTAGSATIGNDATIAFNGNSTAGSAAITNSSSNAVVDFSASTGPNGDGKLSVGSIAGSGSFLLGSDQLSVGGNNQSTLVSGVISGTGGSLVKVGTGTTLLRGALSYTGGTTVSAGEVRLSLGNHLAMGSNLTVNSGGTFAFGGGFNDTIGDLSGTGGLVGVDGGETLTVGTANSTTFAGQILGSGAVVKIGAGTLTLTGANDYAFGTTISAGTLQLGDGSSDGSITGNVTDNAALNVDNVGTTTLDRIVGAGSLIQAGSGTTVLTATESYTGGTIVDAGTLQLGNGGSLASGGNLTINGGTFDLNGNNQTIGDLSGTRGAVTLNGGTLTVGTAHSTTYSGTISGLGGLTKIGSGTLTLLGNDGAPSTSISAGTLQLGNGATAGSLTGNVVDNATFAVDRSDTVTFAGTISGIGAVDQLGTGTTILTVANTYGGGTTIAAGTLELGNGGSITGNATFADAGNAETLRLDTGSNQLGGSIGGFAPNDEIDLGFVGFSSGLFAEWQENGGNTGGTLSLQEQNGATLATLNLIGQYGPANFALTSDGHGGTTIGFRNVPSWFTVDPGPSSSNSPEPRPSRFMASDPGPFATTTYTFIGSAKNQFVGWNDPTVWAGGVVPNSPDADVVFPEITTSGGNIYTSFVTIGSGQSFAADSVSIADNDLELEGTLTVTNAVDVQAGGEINMSGTNLSGGILNAGSLTVESAIEPGDGQVQGSGQINVSGTLTNNGRIVGAGLSISAAAFDNVGTLYATNVTVTVNSGGFSNLSGTTLSGGTYVANGTLDFNVGAVITTDAANIQLTGGGDIQSFDAGRSSYVSLQTSLTTIAQGGTLTLNNQTFDSNGLTDDGVLTLSEGGAASTTFNAPLLTVGSQGSVNGVGTIAAQINNSGIISAGFDPGAIIPVPPVPQNNLLEITGAVSGTGVLEVAAPYGTPGFHSINHIPATLQLDGADSENVVFSNDPNGAGSTLILNDLAGFTGAIEPESNGDTVILPDMNFSSVTGYSYTGTSPDSGILTIQEGATTITLNFIGALDTADFTLSAGPQPISSSPPSLQITVNPTASPPPPHYWYPFDPGPSQPMAPDPGTPSFMASDPGPSSDGSQFMVSDPGLSSFMAQDPGPSSFMASGQGPSSFIAHDPGPSSLMPSDPGPFLGGDPSHFMTSDPGPSSFTARDPGPSSFMTSDPAGAHGWLSQMMQAPPSETTGWLAQFMQAGSTANQPSLAEAGFDTSGEPLAGAAPASSLAMPDHLQAHSA